MSFWVSNRFIVDFKIRPIRWGSDEMTNQKAESSIWKPTSRTGSNWTASNALKTHYLDRISYFHNSANVDYSNKKTKKVDHPFFILLNEIFALGPLQSSSSSVCSCHHLTHHHKNHKHKIFLNFLNFWNLLQFRIFTNGSCFRRAMTWFMAEKGDISVQVFGPSTGQKW